MTLQGLLRYLRKYRPQILIWENVEALKYQTSAGRIIDTVMKAIDEAGGFTYSTFVELNSLDFLLPQRRPRMYGIHCRDSSDADMFGEMIAATLDQLRTSSLLPLEHFLTANSEEIQNAHQDLNYKIMMRTRIPATS